MRVTSEERRNKILHEVMNKKEVSINELSETFHVTTETIRKDVSFLQEKNLLAKKHGSVTLTKPFLESEFSVKEKRQLNEKNAIAEKALDFIPQNASLYLDTSTTVLQLAKLLVMRDDLTIVTNSLQISQILATSDNQVLLTGGQFRKKSNSYVGAWTLHALQTVNLDLAFLCCDGFSKTGPTIRSYQELEIKSSVITHSKKSLILCDSSKLGNQGLYTFSEFQTIDMVLMERPLTDEERSAFPEEVLFYSQN
jgi:DeoR/GlpR family transcriptional regulator of sugar metabolism